MPHDDEPKITESRGKTLIRLVPEADRPRDEEPEDDGSFRPTRMQHRFRETAQQQIADRVLDLSKWMLTHRQRTQEMISMRRWRQWEATPGFNDWFYAILPQAPSEIERRVTHAMAERAFMEKVVEGDVEASRAWIRMNGSATPKGGSATRDAVAARIRKK